jgi:hypothetical protein
MVAAESPTYDSAMTRLKKLCFKNRIRLQGATGEGTRSP